MIFRDLKFPEDKYELGMLIEEAKFYRLPNVMETLKAQRKTRQIKTFRNAVPEKRRYVTISHSISLFHRQKLVQMKRSVKTDYGGSYLPPSVEVPQGNLQFQKWDPMKDPFAKDLIKDPC